MNFTRKLKTLAVAVVAATASQMSFATLLHANPTTGNGSFFFFATDDEGDSYVQSLSNDNGAFRLDSATPITTQVFSLGTSLANILAGSNPVWTVIAGDSAVIPGQGAYSGLRATVTTSIDTSDAGGPSMVRNEALRQGLQATNIWLDKVAVGLPTLVAGNGVFDSGADGDTTDVANFALNGPSFTLNGRLPTEVGLLEVGAQLDAWLFESVLNAANPTFNNINFGTATQQGRWTFNGGTLTYAAVPTAVVPVPAAVWLLGSALVGMTGARRRKA